MASLPASRRVSNRRLIDRRVRETRSASTSPPTASLSRIEWLLGFLGYEASAIDLILTELRERGTAECISDRLLNPLDRPHIESLLDWSPAWDAAEHDEVVALGGGS